MATALTKVIGPHLEHVRHEPAQERPQDGCGDIWSDRKQRSLLLENRESAAFVSGRS